VLIAAVVLAGGGVLLTSGGSGSSSGSGPASTGPLLASADTMATGATVDGIQCNNLEQLLFHVHSHLAVFVNGQQRTIPQGIGIAPPRQVENGATGQFVVSGSCFYWLHAHTSDGVIHIESAIQRTYTLGNYFDIWRQRLARDRVGPAGGPVTAYLNGRPYTGDPRSIPLTAHALVQLDVGAKVAPAPFTFPQGL
jgi:hypothetical protein